MSVRRALCTIRERGFVPTKPRAVNQRAEALAQLPVAYAVALRLSELGVSTDVIAHAVGVEPDAVDPLLRLAHTKLRELLEALGRPSEQH
jgi:DNA-directed RNA polymerase specialized sigma24 family protein